METATQEAPPTSIPYRDSVEKGMPTTGFGVLAGDFKAGKSSLLADFPGAVVLETDAGDANHIPGRILDIRAEGEKSALNVFRAKFMAQVKDPTVKVICVDTVKTLATWVEEEVAGEHDMPNLRVPAKGVDTRALWGEYTTRMIKFLNYANHEAKKLVVFGAHLKDAERDDNNKVIAPAKIDVAGGASAYLSKHAKFIGYCFKEEQAQAQAYFVSFRGGPLASLGSRVKELNDKVLRLPEKNPYSAIDAAIKAYWEKDSQSVGAVKAKK